MNENGTSSDGDVVALRELTARLLTPPTPYEDGTTALPRIYVGRLPEDLPVRMPMPHGAVVAGSVVRLLPRGRREDEILLDVAQPAERFLAAYRQQSLSAGWDEDDWPPGRSGFGPRNLPLFLRAAYRFPRLRRHLGLGSPNLPPVFRLGARGPKLMVAAQDRPNVPTDVRLRLVTGQRDPWLRHDLAWTIIPSLVPPPDVRGRPHDHVGVLHPPPDARGLSGGGGSREPDAAHSHAVLETGLDLAALAAHYAAQLEAAGWTRADEGLNGPQAWNAWTFADGEDRPWTGTFSALRLLGSPGRYLLQIHAGRTPDRS